MEKYMICPQIIFARQRRYKNKIFVCLIKKLELNRCSFEFSSRILNFDEILLYPQRVYATYVL